MQDSRPQAQQPTGIPLPPPPPLHPEIRSVVQLKVAHSTKVYFSGPLVKRIERQPDGQKPNKDEGWVDVWAQLNGSTLSIWDMKLVKEAGRQGKEVPPVYVNTINAVSAHLIYVFTH
jgi:CCR4-NOT transcriptional complex subunit CAF120